MSKTHKAKASATCMSRKVSHSQSSLNTEPRGRGVIRKWTNNCCGEHRHETFLHCRQPAAWRSPVSRENLLGAEKEFLVPRSINGLLNGDECLIPANGTRSQWEQHSSWEVSSNTSRLGARLRFPSHLQELQPTNQTSFPKGRPSFAPPPPLPPQAFPAVSGKDGSALG